MAEIVSQAVIRKIMEYSVEALKKQLNYLCFYSSNVQTLAHELEELNIKYETIQQQVESASANSEVITLEVEDWLRRVEELKIRIDEILRDNEEIQRSSVLKWLPLFQYSLSRKARKASRDCVALQITTFDTISNPGIPAELSPVPNPSYSVFESHKVIEDRIMNALKDPNVYAIGIWGIGGVGKTEMAKNIERKVQKTLFEHVVLAVVSQQLDLPKIQSQIAEGLGLKLSKESFHLRQKKLYKKLTAEKSILIILDDLWEKLNLEALGIPSQSKNCKLILTSRDEDALTSTGVQTICQLVILTKQESWRFFRDNAGINDDDSRNELVEIARKVEMECKGLPLALKIVATALKDKDIPLWNNAVRELQKSVPYNIPGVLRNVYGPLLYSINASQGEEQKDLFLLCCLFPEDYSISIEELLRCVVGLRIFKGLENLLGVRDKVETVLKILLSRSLLINGTKWWTFYVRMHDVIRDVGIWIATEEGMVGSSKEKQLFMISQGLHEWPLMMEEDYIFISLLFSHRSIIFPESIVCPKLDFLRLDFLPWRVFYVELPENFFSGMGGLRVLEALHIGLLPRSIGQLNNLRTLHLQQCNTFETVSVLQKLINLEIFSLNECEIEILPVEIGGLKRLKQMHILNCWKLRRIAFGVISGLVGLEELVILNSFRNWEGEAKIEGGKDGIACLCELDVLKKLTTLKIEIEKARVVPRQKPLWVQNLKRYSISVSCARNVDMRREFKKVIMVGQEVENPLGDWVYDMTNDAELLYLHGSHCMGVLKGLSQNSRNLSCLKELKLSNFTNIRDLDEGLQKGAAIFPMLDRLQIYNSDSFQQISDASTSIGSFAALQEIHFFNLSKLICLWKISVKEQLYLKNLKSILISECHNLSYMFSLSIVQSLVHLGNLRVSSCETMKEMFKKDDGELVKINKIELPDLFSLAFKDLKNLCHFCNGIDRIELPKLRWLFLHNLPSLKMTKGDKNEIHQRYLIPNVAGMNFNFCGLTELKVEGFGNFKCMFSPSIISEIPHLIVLKVKNCSLLEQVIGKDDEIVGETILFPYLKEIVLKNLPNILIFCCNAIQMPSLELLKISQCPLMLKFVEKLPNHISNSRHFLNEQVECPKLKELTMEQLNISTIFSPLFFKSFTNLHGCEEMEHVLTQEGHKISLKSLTLSKLPKLCGSVFQIKHLEFPSLEIIKIEDCPMLEKFSLGSLHLPKLKRVSGMLNNEFAANFLFHSEMSSPQIHSENNCFIISVKDISFSYNHVNDCDHLYVLTPDPSGRSFVDAISFPWKNLWQRVVGKFKTEKIMIGMVYEIMLIIMTDEYDWEDPIEIELNAFGESELQKRTEFLGNQPIDTWTEISVGKFMIREPQQINEEFEFSLRQRKNFELMSPSYPKRRLSIRGVKIVEV